ncbi:hypothetical protein [Pseudomonas aeruginosa]|uniref:hypothetical protein n=1 Tax=Pseudomonas aeruginosa TaxID=287 RepID=UPI00070D4BA6|nr:hypothetical protein [Pseudomonas aeruginosa]HBP6359817.1 hypothetical protein [Pseudomonas aeruginosa]
MTDFTSGFNTTNLKVLRGLINSALANLHPEINIEAGKITYDPQGTCTIKVEATVKGAKSKAQTELEQAANLYGYDVSQTKPHTSLGPCKLVGFNSRARKSPWIVECPKGRYKLEDDVVGRMWGQSKQ